MKQKRKTIEEIEAEYQELRRLAITQILEARTHYYRLQRELAELANTLPDKCFISRYLAKSNDAVRPHSLTKTQTKTDGKTGYWYEYLGCKDVAIPFTRKAKGLKNLIPIDNGDNPDEPTAFTKKLHLGTVQNPNYLTALIELERARSKKIKLDTYDAIRPLIKEKQAYWLRRKKAHKDLLAHIKERDFVESLPINPIDKEIKSEENLFTFINK